MRAAHTVGRCSTKVAASTAHVLSAPLGRTWPLLASFEQNGSHTTALSRATARIRAARRDGRPSRKSTQWNNQTNLKSSLNLARTLSCLHPLVHALNLLMSQNPWQQCKQMPRTASVLLGCCHLRRRPKHPERL